MRIIINYIKRIILVCLLIMAVSPHHHHIYSLCCLSGNCDKQLINKTCETSSDGERVIIYSGEKAICPHSSEVVPILFIWMLLFSPFTEDILYKFFNKLFRWYLKYNLQKDFYEIYLIIFRFLRPPPSFIAA